MAGWRWKPYKAELSYKSSAIMDSQTGGRISASKHHLVSSSSFYDYCTFSNDETRVMPDYFCSHLHRMLDKFQCTEMYHSSVKNETLHHGYWEQNKPLWSSLVLFCLVFFSIKNKTKNVFIKVIFSDGPEQSILMSMYYNVLCIL